MNVRQFVLSSLVLAALARATSVLAEESSDGAVLGPAEPIGKLLVVKAGFDDEPAPLPSVPFPLLEPEEFASPAAALVPVFAPTPEGFFGVLRTAKISPNEEIAFHLSQAALRLTIAGLAEEAKQVHSLLHEFQTKHQTRLLLATKQAQLNELQAEIERLKLRLEKGITADEIQIYVKIIEADVRVAEELLGELANDVLGENGKLLLPEPNNRLRVVTSVLDRTEFLRLIESKRKDGTLRVLSEPVLIVSSGRPGSVHSGGSIPTPKIAQAGGPAELDFGTTVHTTATILDKDRIRVALIAEFAELDHANTVNEIPGVTRRRVQSTLELKDGQTVVLGGLVTSTETKSVSTIITVTAEIVHSLDEIAAPPVEVLQPTPTRIRRVK